VKRVFHLFVLLISAVSAAAGQPANPFQLPARDPDLSPSPFRFDTPSDNTEARRERFDWGSALGQSFLFLGIQHSLRMAQEKTRDQLDGKFWHDYLNSVTGLSGWDDGNPFVTNYIGHPLMGAITGYIQIQNDPAGKYLVWSPHDSRYWKSRFKALGWATVYSTNYELGPLGEAGIGNVGTERGTMAAVDLVVTPIGGFGMILLEDWLDKRYISSIERKTTLRKARVLRVVMNPSRSVANMLRFKRPSYRDTR
jgi:hypothetical protein